MKRLIGALLASVAISAALTVGALEGQSLQKVTINYPTRSGATWPLYIARDGGYYQKQGLDVDLQFGVHPTGIAMLTSNQAVMVNHSLEQGHGGQRARRVVRADGQLVEQGPLRAYRPERVQQRQTAEGQAHCRWEPSATPPTTTPSRC
jgi:hypothetical protein